MTHTYYKHTRIINRQTHTQYVFFRRVYVWFSLKKKKTLAPWPILYIVPSTWKNTNWVQEKWGIELTPGVDKSLLPTSILRQILVAVLKIHWWIWWIFRSTLLPKQRWHPARFSWPPILPLSALIQIDAAAAFPFTTLRNALKTEKERN